MRVLGPGMLKSRNPACNSFFICEMCFSNVKAIPPSSVMNATETLILDRIRLMKLLQHIAHFNVFGTSFQFGSSFCFDVSRYNDN